jgi:Uma2 family endonuclease
VVRPIRYPERDGRPLAETQAHLDQIVYLLVALQQFFAAAPNVFVAADLLLYYVEGDKRKRVAPDVFIARGVRDAKAQRRTYLMWEEGVPPEVVFEITSAGSRTEDTVTKRALYEQLGVREYFLFDPLGEYLSPALQGHRLTDGSYVPLVPQQDGSLRSEVLGLELRLRDGRLRLFEPASGEWLRSPDEQEAERQAEALARQAAEARAAAAEAELQRLKAQLETLRAGQTGV